MNPIEELKNEHRAIEGALLILDKIAEAIETPEGKTDAERLIDFLSVFVDLCHHGKEERVLFRSLESIGVSRAGGPIEVLLREHETGRDHVRGMAEELRGLAAGEGEAGDRFRIHAGDYAALLHQHIDKEDNVLFEIADRKLPPATKNDIQSEFDRIERDVVGEGRHEEFHRMLDSLEEKYRLHS
jgi:hemerythrin-like domain-containing protein